VERGSASFSLGLAHLGIKDLT